MMLGWMFTTDSVTRPTTWYIALHTGDPGSDGSSNEVDTGDDADYVRQSVTYGSAASKQCLNDAAVSWTVNSGSAGFTVTHASVWTASTGGTCLMTGELGAARDMVALAVETFAIGEIVAGLS